MSELFRAVILTRPEGQNEALAARLDRAGIKVVVIPMLAIAARALTAADRHKTDLAQYDEVVVVSGNAARLGLAALPSLSSEPALRPLWFAIGAATADALRQQGISADVPAEMTSEGLLALPSLQHVAGHRVLILRGTGGRETLGQVLTARGATVDYLEVYERKPIDAGPAVQARLAALLPSVAVIYSGETLASFAASAGDSCAGLHVVVPSERIRELPAATRFAGVVVARGADEDAMFAAVAATWRGV